MREFFDENELDPVDSRRDTELTLGPTMMLGLFCGLVLLCGLCFGVGYMIGSRGTHSPPTSVPPAIKAAIAGTGSQSKPAAAPPTVARTRPAAELSPASPEAGTNAVSQDSPSASAGSTQSAAYDVRQVRPALPPSSAPVTSQPATGTAPSVMVQIAAVSHQEDADVLVGALRKRGYSVTASRDIADRLIHVRIGPFASPGDAESTRQKLHNDGYNAIVQP